MTEATIEVVERAGETTTTNHATIHHIPEVVRPTIEVITTEIEEAIAIEVGEANEMDAYTAADKGTRNTHVQIRKKTGGKNQDTTVTART